MSFIDEAEVYLRAGKGGPGAKCFRREKFVPLGGPNGGNGGAGGSIIIRATRNKNTLLDFKHKRKWLAENGQPGQESLKDGRAGNDIVIDVPVGTQIISSASNELVADFVKDGQELTLAKGGRGGKGNAFFKSATQRAPEKTQPGEEGEEGTFLFSLKLLADVGIVGFPNAGKSTLISMLSSAKPKIADYPFTTLTPNLGVVALNDKERAVLADVPGLIPGASEGKGLGIKFLKHLERTKAILHLIDPHMCDEEGKQIPPSEQYQSIRNEMESFSEQLAKLPELVAINKADSLTEEQRKEALSNLRKSTKTALIISAVSGESLDELRVRIGNLLRSSKE